MQRPVLLGSAQIGYAESADDALVTLCDHAVLTYGYLYNDRNSTARKLACLDRLTDESAGLLPSYVSLRNCLATTIQIDKPNIWVWVFRSVPTVSVVDTA